ncbi:HEAT repeat domain-containing protein, partial [Geminocystis sp. CENA526]|uniref:HEAT repeat domain-containing protein n=1 Tax=Geminocystis sp. CENA526 TaxID=1355871 RepID=UPI003D6F3B8D
ALYSVETIEKTKGDYYLVKGNITKIDKDLDSVIAKNSGLNNEQNQTILTEEKTFKKTTTPQDLTELANESAEASGETTTSERLKELANKSIELACLVAKNPHCPPNLLAELAQNEERLVRQAVTNNPNTSKETLLNLGAEFPEEFLDNPIFDLLLLENPSFLAEIPKSTLESIVKLEKFPQPFFTWVLDNSNDNDPLLMALLSNPNLTREHLERLSSHKNSLIAQEAKLHINWNEKIENTGDAIKKALNQSALVVPESKGNIFVNLYYRGIFQKWANEPWAKLIDFCLKDDEMFFYFSFDALKNVLIFNPNTPPHLLEKLLEKCFSKDKDKSDNIPYDMYSSIFNDLIHNSRNISKNLLQELISLYYDEKIPDELKSELAKILLGSYHTPCSVLNDILYSGKAPYDVYAGTNVEDDAYWFECGWFDNYVDRAKDMYEISWEEHNRLFKLLETKLNHGHLNHALIHPQMSRYMKNNPTTPDHLLLGLAWNRTHDLDTTGRTLSTNMYEFGLATDIAGNRFTPQDVLSDLAFDMQLKIHCNLANSCSKPKVLEQIFYDVNSLTGSRWDELSSSDTECDYDYYKDNTFNSLVENPNTPAKVLENMALQELTGKKNWDGSLLREIASHPNTSGKVLTKIASHPEIPAEVSEKIASHPKTPIKILEKLANNDNDKRDISKALLQNPNTPVSLLENHIYPFCVDFLMEGTKPDLGRFIVLFSPYAKVSHLENNFRSTSWLERWAIAQNPNTPDNTLSYLVKDGNKLVRSAAELNIKQKVASNPNIPVALLEKLATDSDQDVRRNVASNPNTPVALLEKLANDSDKDVRREVASNSNTPVTLLKKLATYFDKDVRRRVAENPNTPDNTLSYLVKDANKLVRSAAELNIKQRQNGGK